METLPAVSPEGARHNAAHNCLQLSFEVNIGTEQDHWKGETRGSRREGKKQNFAFFMRVRGLVHFLKRTIV